ncbi:hypothetical protein RS85_00193 [Microbacterium sp. SA39]|nr:hypothetical protein RS85_00193 [Microbacterium sp. SA39]
MCKSADLSVEAITASADGVAAIGTNVVSAVDGASAAWAGVTAPGVFETPDQGAVLALLDPAVEGAQSMQGVTSRVASALETYAGELGSIKSALVDLEERAAAFRVRALQGYEVSNMEKDGFFGSLGLGNDWVPFVADDAWEMTTIPWYEHGPAIEKNKSLVGEYNAIVERVSTAAVACASSIQAELTGMCVAPAEVITAEALTANPDVSTWGSAVEEDRNCSESVGHGFANFATGIAQGAQSLVGVDPETGVQSWETFGKTWSGVGDFVWSTVVLIPLGVRSMFAGGNIPAGEAGYLQDRVNVVASSWGSLIGWDQQAFLAGEDGWHKWSDDGVATFTESAANIGTFFIPVAGVGKVVLTGTRVGSFVVKVGTHMAEFAIPGGSHLISGVVRAADVSASGVRGGWRSLIDAVRLDDVRPAVVPGVVNVAVETSRVPSSVTVSESLGLDTPAARPVAQTPDPDALDSAGRSDDTPAGPSWREDPRAPEFRTELEHAAARGARDGYDPTGGLGWDRFLDEYFEGFTSNGNPKWHWPDDPPHTNGFTHGLSSPADLATGDIVERITFTGPDGPLDGRFAAPPGTPFGDLALPPDRLSDSTVTQRFEVLRPLPENIRMGEIAPGFGQRGHGTQYYFPDMIGPLIDAGYLREIR